MGTVGEFRGLLSAGPTSSWHVKFPNESKQDKTLLVERLECRRCGPQTTFTELDTQPRWERE